MVREIRVYIEGAGDRSDTKAAARSGWGQFLGSIRDLARARSIRWEIILCGSRNATFEAFDSARNNYPEAFLVLLVDSEAPVTRAPWEHLHSLDDWALSKDCEDSCHLMAQVMEAWLIADSETLEAFYGEGFRYKALPARKDVEAVSKADLLARLARATEGSRKGSYHKTLHAPKLLERIDPDRVRDRAKHCDRLFTTLTGIIEGR